MKSIFNEEAGDALLKYISECKEQCIYNLFSVPQESSSY
jgi:hypothetical protein